MTPTKTLNWTDASLALERAYRVVIVAHISPDGDAIGSILALGNALKLRGKHVEMAVDGGAPDFAQFLPGANMVRSEIDSGEWDVMVALDSSDVDRLGRCGAYALSHSKTVVNIDHHPSNTYFGHHQIVIADAVSTTEILQRWFVILGIPLRVEIATPLLTGLLTDTIGFRTSNVRPDTLQHAQRLMEAGAPYHEVVQRTLNSKSYRAILLWQRVLPSVTIEDGLVSAMVRKEDWQVVGYHDETDAGLVGYLIATDEAKIAVVYKETGEGSIDLSMRAKPGCDVAAVAVALGGGGHVQAAGANIPGTLEDAIVRVRPMLRAALKC